MEYVRSDADSDGGVGVDIRMHTHSAIRPPAFEGESVKERCMPGLTLRDVRLAILLDVMAAEFQESHRI